MRILQTARENPAVGGLLRNIQNDDPAVRSLDLSSFLLQPSEFAAISDARGILRLIRAGIAVQRLTRYPLLLRQVSRNHP